MASGCLARCIKSLRYKYGWLASGITEDGFNGAGCKGNGFIIEVGFEVGGSKVDGFNGAGSKGNGFINGAGFEVGDSGEMDSSELAAKSKD